MKDKLTKRVVEAVKPSEKNVWVYDTELKGFGLKVTPAGNRVYFVQYWFGGRRKRFTIGTHGAITADQARKVAAHTLGTVAGGDDPQAEKTAYKKGETVKDFADRYMAEHAMIKKKKLSIESDERLLRLTILPAIGRLKIANIDRQIITKLHHDFRGEPVKANRALALLSKMFNLSEKWGMRPDGSNPCRHVEKYKETPRERFLSEDELARLGQVLAEVEEKAWELPSVVTAIRLLILTGFRLGEVLNLKWSDIDQQRGVIVLEDSKTGWRLVPLNVPAVEALERAQVIEGNPYICPGVKEGGRLIGIQCPWARIRERAGIPDVRLHDLRHSFASVAASSGMGLPIIGGLLGHTQASTTQRYAHLANDPLKQASGEVARRIQEAMNKKPERKVIPITGRK